MFAETSSCFTAVLVPHVGVNETRKRESHTDQFQHSGRVRCGLPVLFLLSLVEATGLQKTYDAKYGLPSGVHRQVRPTCEFLGQVESEARSE